MKNFALKFIDIMIGMVLGLGFQWWPNLHEPWQFAAFIFIYLDIIDYWIDYSPSLKKFPPKTELDLMLDIGIMFLLFLLIFSTQLTLLYFLAAFVAFRLVDTLWLMRAHRQYHPRDSDKLFIETWIQFNMIEVAGTALLFGLSQWQPVSTLGILGLFIIFRSAMRALASMQYKRVHFA